MNDLNENHMKMEGSEDPNNNNNNNKDKNFPEIGEFKAKLNSKAHGQHQVSLEYKQLPEIKQNLNKILLEWTSENSNAIKIEKV